MSMRKGVFQLSGDDVITLRDNGYPAVDHLQVGSWYFLIGKDKVLQGPFVDPNEAQEALEASLGSMRK